MSEHVETPPSGRRRKPHKVYLPGFIDEEDIGLGDVIRKATSMAGVRPCGGCNERAERLNDWMVFSARPSADS
ncbi:hypothetical protein [Streptomyces calvus]|jgi:hypothetical protein|uniref:Uncharacterized protein n=1 Tax=Streptomyces calvus TaxID=67282 RepID=A0A514K0F3_9ACTN|nr:hypothetical protein [Streptomyces calvus]QDI72542.1 hypothetical protein CD934_30480 [Streptomyces calvus]